MSISIYSLLLLKIFFQFEGTTGDNFRTINPEDSIFKKTVLQFETEISEPFKINPFPSANDSTLYVNNLFILLNNELSTNVFNKKAKYSDFSFTTNSYYLSIHEIILPAELKKISKNLIKVKSEAPVQLQLIQIRNRILIFSYSPSKNNSKLKEAIDKFEKYYRTLAG